ncbi:MAG: 2,5-diamino-6-(ribosylamino)-4(3H)-pyrimidinone 5'-phosphate reductase [Candidatus Thorarchaeota archaeon]
MKRPYVILNAAMTLDGKIASKTGDSKISDEMDLIEVHRLRNEVDAIMVGINTVLIDDPILNVRLVEKKQNPIRVIVDSQARIPNDSQIIKTAKEIDTYLAISNEVEEDRRQKLVSFGVKVIVCGNSGGVDLTELMHNLAELGVRVLMLEGGSVLNWSMLSSGLVDEIRLTIAPTIVGGRKATSLVSGEGFADIESGVKLTLVKLEQRKDFVMVQYKVQQK